MNAKRSIKKMRTAIERVNKNHGRSLAKLGEGIDSEFIAEVDDFIAKYRIALKRLAKK